MQSSLTLILIGALAVAMVTAAPLSNQEKFVETSQTGVSLDRAKRAQETINFGNQQNKPRVLAKKSDLSNLLLPVAPLDEKDKSGVVVAHDALPVPPDMNARAEAALERNKDQEKMKEEMEAALQEAETKVPSQKADGVTKQEVKELVKEELTQEVKDAAEKTAAEEPSSELAELADGQGDEVDQFLHDIQDKDAENGLDMNVNSADDNAINSELYPILYFNSPYRDYGFRPRIPYSLYRKKRAVKRARRISPFSGHRGARRIKRDSLSDLYGAYANEDPRDEAEEYIALSPEEKDYLYRRLIDNVADLYDEGQGNELQEIPIEIPYIEEAGDAPYLPYEVYGESSNYNPYLEGYRGAQLEYEPAPTFAKRGMVDYYPFEEMEKRYFFPFSDEPDTHWGAFVPEKRDYNEAIQRLQRLAEALNDNPGAYYKDALEEYRKK
ncbi:uncharacterized protein LOC106061432 [Biomphalaria glabrata]|uniref:Uncharacterized protein LOC106061432 n=1 Tax=Biomphalaria glabrata TaxID=6526 RepID=A0A9W3AS25_BIOGL|nr:uncharacterized protein LOC106061432 [Biomphalaria glabrata]XP_055890076.1 uncharacterized protein LOC106061432 [Biomphalaria glabrata]XP_055890077.1 uncharacterized protein LOC106061432 [Biomphalaria glabrata]XP_055890078.1 uncharacterized protein LOC106061432 [Biomphalaria glabrata]